MGRITCLLLGLVAGWAVAELTSPSPTTGFPRMSSASSIRPDEFRERDRETLCKPPAVAAVERGTHLASTVSAGNIREATLEDLQRLLAGRQAIDVRVIPDLCRQLDLARAEQYWDKFRVVLALLARTDDRSASERLVEVMAARDVPSRVIASDLFLRALQHDSTRASADAARWRAERALEEEQLPGLDNWLTLAASHGRDSHLEWVASLTSHPVASSCAWTALVEASGQSAAVAETFERLYAKGSRGDDCPTHLLAKFARRNPDSGARLLEQEILRMRGEHLVALFTAYGESIADYRLPQTKAFLGGLTAWDRRVAASFAIARMHRRGMDTSGLEVLSAAPTEALERLTSGIEMEWLDASLVRRAIRVNPLGWSDRSVRALEAGAATFLDSRNSFGVAARSVQLGLQER